jgi:hypothetical protein
MRTRAVDAGAHRWRHAFAGASRLAVHERGAHHALLPTLTSSPMQGSFEPDLAWLPLRRRSLRGGGVLHCIIKPVLARLPTSPVLVGGDSSRSQAQRGPFVASSPRACCRLGSWRLVGCRLLVVVPCWAVVRPAYGRGLARSVHNGASMVGVRCWCSVEVWST